MNSLQYCVIKIGSNVLTQEDGNPDLSRIQHLVFQITFLRQQQIKVILVSSGAVAFGKKEIQLPEKLNPILKKQIWSSTGQIELIQTYKMLFKEHGIQVSQILVTKEDFRDRKHFLNMKNCIQGLVSQDILPIINENDSVAITELMFTDNDELASLTAAMVNADSLVLLTNVNGIYTGVPEEKGSKLIKYVGRETNDLSSFISASKSSFGRGGMLTKLNMAKKSADLGIQVFIANGKKTNILEDIFLKKGEYTFFEPNRSKQSTKKWLAHGERYFVAEIIINEGAKTTLFNQKIASLLPVGIIMISGEFKKGDILCIKDNSGNLIGLGRAEYNSIVAKEKIGLKNQKPIIHYDYLYLIHHD
ncbi:glutamate 5-kinase [Belliella baltica DSM 15883]|uniref:Glutamate 5-kinase n=1 Tax=Belliella baltica (strain DSM 15883 / CIP 108006 / LMG 21964 / BA134) TaxID=866536 RepID=I3Z9L8_BELBD|nr:glutamate 5-kinase [Belliella baltica]AFL85936.1 glutamate 5-kinase [Belliella baltica DSM 15883]